MYPQREDEEREHEHEVVEEEVEDPLHPGARIAMYGPDEQGRRKSESSIPMANAPGTETTEAVRRLSSGRQRWGTSRLNHLPGAK